MSGQPLPPPPPHNPYYDQQAPPPAGWNAGPASYNQGTVPSYAPPAYGAYGPPPPGQQGYGQQGYGQQQPPPMFPPPVHGFAAHQAMAGEPHDVEANLIKGTGLGFDNKSVRAGFVRKVRFFSRK